MPHTLGRAQLIAETRPGSKVRDIALKATEGTSGAKALAHINQFAMEQANRRSSRMAGPP